jgi:hypothetical protein
MKLGEDQTLYFFAVNAKPWAYDASTIVATGSSLFTLILTD